MTWPPDPDVVQHISLPLELLGLFLAFLEIFFHQHAKHIETTLDRLESHYFKLPLDHRQQMLMGSTLIITIGLTLVMSIHAYQVHYLLPPARTGLVKLLLGYFAMFLLCPVLLWTWWKFPMWGQHFLTKKLLRPIWFVAFGFTQYIIVVGTMIIDLFNSFGKGHAIGGIGLSLGFIGLIGEVYQVLMIDRNADPITIVEYWALVALVIIALGAIAFFVHRAVKRSPQA